MRTKLLIFGTMMMLAMVFVKAQESAPAAAGGSDGDFSTFEASMEDIRQALKITAMSAAVVRDQELIWAQGFGFADLENHVEATPDTPYGLASVTKPIAATLIMQLVEEGDIDLDAPAASYGVQVESQGVVTVRHLLTHTSEGVPGAVHNYNGGRYGLLGGIIEGATGRTFASLLSERFLIPLGMTNTAVNPINSWGGPSQAGLEEFKYALGWGDLFQHYPDVYLRLAQPYQFDSKYNIIDGMYNLFHNPAGGLISSVTDIARFDIALDQHQLLDESTKAEMFAPAYDVRVGLVYAGVRGTGNLVARRPLAAFHLCAVYEGAGKEPCVYYPGQYGQPDNAVPRDWKGGYSQIHVGVVLLPSLHLS
jgi:CubicO group peptidase (beta-lactamase class C family)